ncbi:MAG: dihydropteroate synthase [Desulfarculaceae bacterium]|nr:dihydropteroate synthase [Desulfarculaceae bacterium]MCF8047091.1 dihydropteroate synthase [Desulfarculaceae bacterium]MCF8064607.1 dihydropteroate synthase [Desulfarculaceae bacterium]MCF8097313.1 dihydropteroate synthase [Desulfarculaceae bacterium]MCF8121880.1 dihydropteroate synthase [Desulfarculaceae bacterium]
MIVAADNLTTSRPSVRRAVEARDEAFVQSLCQSLEQAGAAWIDLNPGYLPLSRREGTWAWLVKAAEASCSAKLILDAADPASLEMALGFCTRPPVLNMATAEESRLGPVLDIAAHHGLEVIAATMTATVPPSAEERLALAASIVQEADARGITGGRLIIDPMAMPLALPGGEAHAQAVLSTLRALPQVFDPPPRRLIALSNLVTASAGARSEFAAAPYLSAAFGAGLEVVMMDALNPELMRLVRLLNVFEGQDIFAPGEFAP